MSDPQYLVTLNQAKAHLGFTLCSISSAVFSGSGLNDATSGGTYTGNGAYAFEVIIDHVGATDSFKWRKGAGTWTEDVTITGHAQTLSDGITVTFGAVTGHTLAAKWTIIVSGDGTQDEKITLFLAGVTKMIQNHCNRIFFLTEDIEEYIDGDGDSDDIFLKQYPVTKVTTVKSYEVEVPARVNTYDPGYVLYANEGYLHYPGGWSAMLWGWSEGHNNIYVKYSAGYATIPADVQMAAINLLTHIWNAPVNADIFKEETPGGYKITYQRSQIKRSKIPDDIDGMLEPYIRRILY